MLDIKQSRSLYILLVDDQDDVRITLAELLSLRGHRVIDAVNGQQALELYHANQSKIDLIISDICMPVLSGIEFGEKVREKNENIPIVFITGFTEGDNFKTAEDIGNRIFTKPINYLELELFIATL